MTWRNGTAVALTAAALSFALPVAAEEPLPQLVIDGQALVTHLEAPADSPLPEIISGWHFRSTETQELETDDFLNPAFLVVDTGETLWNEVDGTAGKACASCHGDAVDSMKGVRAAMPKWSEARGKPITMEQQINECRTERMGAEAWKWESSQMLGMTAFVGLQSRGMPVQVQTDGPMESWWEKGKELYYQRTGQLDMSCALCHEQNYGNMIRADRLSQGQINGFPVYRLKWGGVGSIHRRFEGCVKDTRAEPYKRGSDELIALELYVAWRGTGLSVETPSVRN